MTHGPKFDLTSWQQAAFDAGRLTVLHVPIVGHVRIRDGRAYHPASQPHSPTIAVPPIHGGQVATLANPRTGRAVTVTVAAVVAIPDSDSIRPVAALAAGGSALRQEMRLPPTHPIHTLYASVLWAAHRTSGPWWEITLVAEAGTGDDPVAA
jgi:hypothetical protein